MFRRGEDGAEALMAPGPLSLPRLPIMITGAPADVTPRGRTAGLRLPRRWDTRGECAQLTASLARSSASRLTVSTCSDVTSLCTARFLLTHWCGMTYVLVQETST